MDVGRPAALAATLRELLEAGVPLERALPAFTCNPARLLRLGAKGRLTAGADADVVVLGADGTVDEVMAMGRWHVRGGRPVVHGTFERLEGW